jgi:hypothetical protein
VTLASRLPGNERGIKRGFFGLGAGPNDPEIYPPPSLRPCKDRTIRVEQIGNHRLRNFMPITKLPGVVACSGAVVVASESSNPEALLTLKLKTETGDQFLLPLSEGTTRQLQLVIAEFNRTRDLLFVEERSSTSATLQ